MQLSAALREARAPGAALRGDSGGNDTDVMGMLAGIEEPPGIHLPAVLLVVLLLLDPADLAVQVTSVVPGAVLASISVLVDHQCVLSIDSCSSSVCLLQLVPLREPPERTLCILSRLPQ